MNYLDIILIIPIAWGAYKGFKKGLVSEISSLAALIFGVYGAIKFSDYTSSQIMTTFEWDSKYLPVISFAITFIIIVILVHLLSNLIETLISKIALGFFNKILGLIFGMLKFGLILSIILVIFDSVEKNFEMISKKDKSISILYTPLLDFSVVFIPAFQESNFYKKSENYINSQKKDLEI